MDRILFDGKEFIKTKYNGYYACKEGRIISVFVIGAQGRMDFNKPRYLAVKIDKDGYREVVICIDGKRKYIKVHRIIWETFNGNIPEDKTIDHIKTVREGGLDNLDNLRLLTRENNTSRATSKKVKVTLDGVETVYNSNREAYTALGLSESSFLKYKNGKINYIKKFKNNDLKIENM